MEERRKSVRVGLNSVVLFKAKNTRLAHGARCKNISETGICIPTNRPFPVNVILELEIRSDDLQGSIKALGRVARITEPNNGNSKFEVGIEMFDIPIIKQRIIQDYIQETIARKAAQDSQDSPMSSPSAISVSSPAY